MPATLSITFTDMAKNSAVLSPTEQQQVATGLEDDAEVISNTALGELLVDQPADVQAEIIRINTEARPFALQVALLVPLIAGLLGLITSLRTGASVGRPRSLMSAASRFYLVDFFSVVTTPFLTVTL